MKNKLLPLSPNSPLQFPCVFPIKAMGRNEEDFELFVASVVRKHSPEPDILSVRSRLSREGAFLSVTVTITATSREQLDRIYLELSGHERVLMLL